MKRLFLAALPLFCLAVGITGVSQPASAAMTSSGSSSTNHGISSGISSGISNGTNRSGGQASNSIRSANLTDQGLNYGTVVLTNSSTTQGTASGSQAKVNHRTTNHRTMSHRTASHKTTNQKASRGNHRGNTQHSTTGLSRGAAQR